MMPAVLALAWLIGIAAAASTGTNLAASLAAAGLFGAISIALRPRTSTLFLIAVGVALIWAAAGRYDSTVPKPSALSELNGSREVRLRAVVDSEPFERGVARVYRLQVRERMENGAWVSESGAILASGSLYPRYEFGDLLEVEGEMEDPPVLDEFDYREYLLRQGVSSVMEFPEVTLLDTGQGDWLRSSIISLRSRLVLGLERTLPEPQASLAAGVLLGKRSQLPDGLKEDMQATGTAHLVAVSGQNIVLVAGMAIAVLARAVGRRNAAWMALAAVLGYALLVGGEPSVVRAAVMGALYVASIALGRQNSAGVTIILAAAGMTAFDPQIVHDVSFQLSFAATLGLVLAAPTLSGSVEQLASRWPVVWELPATRTLKEVLVMTVSATAFTMPIIAINFHRVSLVAPLANLFAVPAFVLVAATSGATALVSLVSPEAARTLGWLAWLPAWYMTEIITMFAALPIVDASLRGVGVWHGIAYFALLYAGILWLRGRWSEDPIPDTPTPQFRWSPLLLPYAIAALTVLSAALLGLAQLPGRGHDLSVTFLNVGQGDAILIEGPAGNRILVDGGPSGEAISAALGRNLPFHSRRLDLVILTHPQQDHLAGLPHVIERFDIRMAAAPAVTSDTAAYSAWQAALELADVPQVVVARGQWVDLGSGASVVVIGPVNAAAEDLNDASVVLRISMGNISFLLTGDVTERGEAALMRAGTDLNATVLKVAHHGSGTSTSDRFLRAANPIIDVISVGTNNPYGHPAGDVLDRLSGDLVLRTDLRGDVTVRTDGARVWVETQRDAE